MLTVVKTFAQEDKEQSIWDDKDFVAEIELRSTEFQTGKVKGYTWEEVKDKARKLINDKNQEVASSAKV